MKKRFYISDFEITAREVLIGIGIVSIMLVIGIVISGRLSAVEADNNARLNKALKIQEQELFEYGMRTSVGDAFVYGELSTVDPVTFPELGGEYMYVAKVEEEYTMHTREVAHTTTDANGNTSTYYTTEIYWTWDFVGMDDVKCTEVIFCGVKFPVNKIEIPDTDYKETIYESSTIRYNYYTTDKEHTGTIFTNLRDNSISDRSKFYKNKSIDDTVKALESHVIVVLFWVIWIVIICVCVFGFFALENKWLD